MWCSIGRGRKLRRVAGRRGARRGRIAASSPTRCPGDARGVPRVRIPSRARPRGHLPGAHRAKPRRFFASPNSIWRRLGGRTFAVQRVGRLISPLCVPAAITRGCAGVVARRREVQTRSRAALSARVSGCLTRRFAKANREFKFCIFRVSSRARRLRVTFNHKLTKRIKLTTYTTYNAENG